MKLALDRAAHCPPFRPAPDPWIDALGDLCYEPEQLLVLGAKATTGLNLDAAINTYYRRALEIDPKNSKIHLAMGKALFLTGQSKDARAFFQKAIELDPKSDEAYFQLGVILQIERNLKEAEQMFLKALELQPDNENVSNNLGVALLEQKRFPEAIKYLNKVLDIAPENINARYNLGMSLWGMGRTREAIEQYRQVLRLKPEWATAANSLAWILATDKSKSNRNGQEALRWALVACTGANRTNPAHLDTLAAAYAEAGNFERAVKTAEECLNLARAKGETALAQSNENFNYTNPVKPFVSEIPYRGPHQSSPGETLTSSIPGAAPLLTEDWIQRGDPGQLNNMYYRPSLDPEKFPVTRQRRLQGPYLDLRATDCCEVVAPTPHGFLQLFHNRPGLFPG
jgi:Flp pilus assembly protein TadD